MFKNLEGFFSFSRAERNGFILLSVLIFILIGLISVQRYWQNSQLSSYPEPNSVEFYSIDSLLAVQAERKQNEQKKDPYWKKNRPARKKKMKDPELFPFNPNTLDQKGWEQLGFSEKQAASIIKYKKKGGKFYQKEDVKKLYVVDAKKYAQLEPYIELEQQSLIENERDSIAVEVAAPKETTEKVELEINTATKEAFQRLKGIGEILSERIVKFRNRLGGFHKTQQLLEVYGLKPEVFETFHTQLTVNQDVIKQLSVNTIVFKDLLKHPYFDYDLVKELMNYRDKNGHFHSLDQLKSLDLMTPELFGNIEPYLSIQ